MREDLHADEEEAAELKSGRWIVLIAQINRSYALAEPLDRTLQRPWWDLLAFQLALVLERDMVTQAQAAARG